MQETQIDESAFENNPFIANNFNIIFNNSETGYGVCSLINRKFSTKDELLHPSGRIIAFNIGDLTMTNIYLPSGAERTAKNLREDLCGQTIPNMMLAAKKKGMIGGDFNCITHPSDCTHHPEPKMSPNLKKTSTIPKWRDTYRLLHPKSTTYSHFYNCQMTGTGLTQGALDRSYTWGDIKTVSSEYIGAAFSDHMLHLVRLECPEATEAAEDHFKPYFKISPETAKDAEFQDRVQQQAAKQISRERAKEKRATLTFLMLVQSHLSKKTSKGNLSLLPKLKSIQLRINNWFDEQAEKVRLHSRLKDKSLRKSGSTTMSSSTEPTIKAQSPSSKHHWGSSVATKSVQTFSTKMCQLYLRQRQNWSKQHKDNCWMKLKKCSRQKTMKCWRQK